MSRRSNRLALGLVDSERKLQILQLRRTLMSRTTHWPTTWPRQHRPQRVIKNYVTETAEKMFIGVHYFDW